MISATDSAVHAETDEHSGLRERKKDATRRALAEAAMNLAIERGYAAVTIADITDAVGVSRRTFSNYFAGKAECIAAVSQGWFRDIAQSIREAPADHPLDQILCDALLQIAPSAVVQLNRAVAVAMRSGPQEALTLVDGIEGLDGSYLLPSVRGELLSRLGRHLDAAEQFDRAAALSDNERERQVLVDKAIRERS